MTAATDQFQRWLDQGYIDAEGFAPASDHQSAVSKRYGRSLGTTGDEDARPGGGGLPFSREAPSGRDYRWDVNSPEDILRFMEFANEMAPHTMDRQASFGIPQYTGQDVYDFFIRPQEVARMDAARKGLHGSLDRGRRMAASEGAKLASSMFGGGATAGGELEARAGRTLADMALGRCSGTPGTGGRRQLLHHTKGRQGARRRDRESRGPSGERTGLCAAHQYGRYPHLFRCPLAGRGRKRERG